MLPKRLRALWPLGRRSSAGTGYLDEPRALRVAVFNDTRAAGHYGCDLVMHELIRLLRNHRLEPVWFYPVGADWREERDALSQISDIDAVIVNGEGSIHHSRTRPRAVYLAEVATFSRDVLRVPCFLVNSTIRSIDESVAEHLGRFDRIYVRESASLHELEGFGIEATVVPDLTVLAELHVAPEPDGVCGTDSVLVDVSRGIRELCRHHDWPFRSMVWKHKKSGSLPVTPGGIDGVQDFARYLSSHRLVITGRFHTVTFCLATATPFVSMDSNTNKISAVMKDAIGDQSRLLTLADLAVLDPDRFSSWSPHESIALRSYIQKARSAATSMLVEIQQEVMKKSMGQQ